MNILLIGSGGREHALAWKIRQSPLNTKLYIAPGNAGTAFCGTNLPISTNDFDGLASACIENNIGLVIVGPEEPLVNGIFDFFLENPSTNHIAVIGPSKAASALEGSKTFAKAFMKRHEIPTAAYAEFTSENYEEGVDYIKSHSLPVVLKADGLASGKGVLICQNHLEALSEFELMIHQFKFGEAGKKVLVEEFLAGIELSVFVLTDGKDYVILPEAKDYKRIGEGDKGLNTGGMGAVSPVPFVDDAFLQEVRRKIIEPTLAGLAREGLVYRGFLFLGLMNLLGKPSVIEYNCRMGDPEAEVVIPRIQSDLVELFLATAQQRLKDYTLITDKRSAVTVVAVSGGYPGPFETGREITGLQQEAIEGSIIFQSGTIAKDGKIVSTSGRVLAVTSFGDNITEAAEQSNYMMEQIYFDEMYYRNDIGFEFR